MTLPFWCLLVACILPYVLAGVNGYYKTRQLGSIEANEPRVQAMQLTGAGGRSVAAQENAWEALPVFAAGVVVNHLVTGGAGLAGTVAVVWVIARIVHAVAYVQDVAALRVGGFLTGLVCSLTLFGLAARG